MQPDHPLPQFPTRSTCTLCALHTGAHSVGVPTLVLPNEHSPNPTYPAIVFVGQNPGHEEDQSNQPFIGRSGRIIRATAQALAAGSPTPVSIYLTNTARCYTRPETPPTAKHYSTCVSYLIEDLAQIVARHSRTAVVTLGAPACTHLLRVCGHPHISLKKGFGLAGTQLTLPDPPQGNPTGQGPLTFTFFATYHPAYLLRSPGAAHPFADHITLVQRWLHGTLPIPSSPRIVPPFPPERPHDPQVHPANLLQALQVPGDPQG